MIWLLGVWLLGVWLFVGFVCDVGCLFWFESWCCFVVVVCGVLLGLW